jgi:acetylornithine deacetylase/succinyl-diaminopimelate desuccinylase-like protein
VFAEAQRWFARERVWLNEQHLQLCRIPSPTFFERQRAEWFRGQLEALGWTATLDRAGNVIGTFGPSSVPRSLLLSAHLDTVFAPSRAESVFFAPDGRLVGPGTSDNGSGLTALLAFAKLLTGTAELHDLASSLLIVANVGEEGEGNLSGMRYLCQHTLDVASIRAFVVLDGPATDHITAQALASRRFEIGFSGPGGHSWNDYGTPNPVHALSIMVHSFLGLAEERSGAGNRGSCAYNFSVIEGGTSINAIPCSARAKLDIRSEDPALVDELASLLSTVVERSLEQANRSAKTHRLTAKIKDLGSRPGGKLPAGSDLLQTVQAVDAHLQIRSRVDCASTDANVPLSLGLPAISIGTGGHGGGAHTENEWFQPDGREAGLQRILLLLMALFELQQL